jgi:hypothetical protein
MVQGTPTPPPKAHRQQCLNAQRYKTLLSGIFSIAWSEEVYFWLGMANNYWRAESMMLLCLCLYFLFLHPLQFLLQLLRLAFDVALLIFFVWQAQLVRASRFVS